MRWLKTRLWSEHADLIWGGFKDKKHLIFIYTHCFSPSLLPRVPEHPAFLSSPSHLGRCASPRSHRAWAVSSLSVWRRRLRTSSDPGLLWWCSGMPRRVGSCTEVSKPRGSCRSHACTVRPDSPTWPRRSPRTWRSSASLNRSARQVRKKKKNKTKTTQQLGDALSSPRFWEQSFLPPPHTLGLMRSLQETLPTPSNCRVYTTAPLHKSGPIRAGRAAWRGWWAPVKQLLNFLTWDFFFFFFFSFFSFFFLQERGSSKSKSPSHALSDAEECSQIAGWNGTVGCTMTPRSNRDTGVIINPYYTHTQNMSASHD